jgi:hypothetical protein
MTRTVLAVIVVINIIVVAMLLALDAESVEAVSDKWFVSGHADRTSDSFRHWDEDEPPRIPPVCAKCHSTHGFIDFLGLDDTEFRSVDNEAFPGSVVNCITCHNETIDEMDTVIFPSGAEIEPPDDVTACYQCHQGRASTIRVAEAIEGLGADTVSEDLSFISVHYYVAAATRMGGLAMGAYQYEDAVYAGFYEHVDMADRCSECHDPHSLEIDPQSCATCHLGVVNESDIFMIREDGTDWDGDADVDEGIAGEVETTHAALLEALQIYSAEVVGTPIVYAPGSFPYWFVDTDADGVADPDEVAFPNQYNQWTPRLLRTAYNHHYVQMDPGAFAHNGAYTLQILHDSLVDLSAVIDLDLDGLERPEEGL